MYDKIDLVVITEHGVMDVYRKDDAYFIKLFTKDFIGYERVHASGMMTMEEVESKYPEVLV